LHAWPLDIWSDSDLDLTPFRFVRAYCVVAHPRLKSRGDPLPRQVVPGRLLRRGFAKALSREQLLNFLAAIPRWAAVKAPIDLLLFVPVGTSSRSLDDDWIEACFAGGAKEEKLAMQRYSGFWLYVHDSQHVSFTCLRRRHAYTFLGACLQRLAKGVSSAAVRWVWTLLRRCGPERCLVCAGYEKTIFCRMAAVQSLDYEDFREFFRWDLDRHRIYRAGWFGADLRRMAKERELGTLRPVNAVGDR